jgi:hypothetical protein
MVEEEKRSEWPLRVRRSMRVLVARVLLVLLTTLLVPGTNPLSVTTQAAFQCLVAIGIAASGCNSSVDDVFGLEPADVLCNGRDDVTAKFFSFTQVFALQAELVLLGHVLASHSTDFVHDMEEDGLGCAVAGRCVLVLVTNIAACDIHGSVSGEGDAVGELLAPACKLLVVLDVGVRRCIPSVYNRGLSQASSQASTCTHRLRCTE